ncbi:MAG: beta-glucosidase [Kangiellaceae bacterium]|jgi:beta-glucosidase
MIQDSFFKLTSLTIAVCMLSACSLKQAEELPSLSTQNTPDVECIWGSAQFDICRFNSKQEIVSAFVNEMTLDEKIGQMTQSVWHNNVSPELIQAKTIGSIIHTEGPVPGPNVNDWVEKFDTFQQHALQTRLGIPLLIGVDAVHGQNTFEGAVIFPHNLGMGATRNFELIKRAAEITAIETAGTGFNWTFSPVIAMPEHEHWGRVYEGFSENAEVTTKAVIASVQGHQGGNLAARNTIAATAKHYLGDGATIGGREGGESIIDDGALNARYLPPYIAAVDEGIASIMVGFNSVNGINMHQHEYLVQNVLKQQLGFTGVVLTDWLGGTRWGEPYTVINAGIDIAMQPGNHDEFMSKLKATVLDGTVSMERINDAVSRILSLKFDLGLFKDPFVKRENSALVGSTQHREVARQAVRESLVLLKSESGALPLKADEAIAVVGKHANNSGLQSGGWSIHWQGQTHSYASATTILDGIQGFAADVEYNPSQCTKSMTAKKVVAVVGELPYAEFMGDSDNINLNPAQQAMIEHCKALGKQVIVVLISGRALTVNDAINTSDAFIAAWLPGSEGAGVADFLFAANGFLPVGKLPTSWPAQYADLPLAENSDKALYPFGFGLSEY